MKGLTAEGRELTIFLGMKSFFERGSGQHGSAHYTAFLHHPVSLPLFSVWESDYFFYFLTVFLTELWAPWGQRSCLSHSLFHQLIAKGLVWTALNMDLLSEWMNNECLIIINMRVIKETLSLRVTLSLQNRDYVFAYSLWHLSLDMTMSKITLNTSIFMSKRRMTVVNAMEAAVRVVTVCRHPCPCLQEAVRYKRQSLGQLRGPRNTAGSPKAEHLQRVKDN